MDIKWHSGLYFYNGRLILNSVVSNSDISRVLKLIIRLEHHTTACEIILEIEKETENPRRWIKNGGYTELSHMRYAR